MNPDALQGASPVADARAKHCLSIQIIS